MATKRYKDLRSGDVVVLPANPDEGWPEEVVTVQGPLELNELNGCWFLYADLESGEISEIPVEDPEAEVRLADGPLGGRWSRVETFSGGQRTRRGFVDLLGEALGASASDQRDALWEAGRALAEEFVSRNGLPAVRFSNEPAGGNFGYYEPRARLVVVEVRGCQRPSTGGRAWSFPGYKADRTPYGVVCHELGHHWHLSSPDPRGLAREFRRAVRGERPLTSYAPNTGEDIAESFRLFVTNPSLLEAIRPLRYAFLRARLEPVETRHWREVLAGSDRHLRAAGNQARN